MTERNQAESGETSRIGAFSPIPAARPLSDFAVEQVGDDLVILDGETLQYHTLNQTAVWIWRACSGTTTAASLAGELGIPVEVVESTVAELGEAGLLTSPARFWDSTFTRRRATKLIAAGLVGAVGLPVIKSITAPDSASAATICVPVPFACGICNSIPGCSCASANASQTCCRCATPLQFNQFQVQVAQQSSINSQIDTSVDYAVEPAVEDTSEEIVDNSVSAPAQDETPADSGGDAGNSGGDTSEPVETSGEEPTEEPAG